ncbi:unnamed protein product [Vicia faba]|uniref:Secreted protein n=1 Tax=Vicia faba TaxID=3906 RepID=A0AAV1BC75_VICFA|nr:unnamed protein product [Vicia faba]
MYWQWDMWLLLWVSRLFFLESFCQLFCRASVDNMTDDNHIIYISGALYDHTFLCDNISQKSSCSLSIKGKYVELGWRRLVLHHELSFHHRRNKLLSGNFDIFVHGTLAKPYTLHIPKLLPNFQDFI